MLETRVIPCLLLREAGLVKTVKFKNPIYVGDPINTVRIFNEMEVDELIFLDITATVKKKGPPFKILEEIASECFMPITYGGCLRCVEDVKKIFSLGIEKVSFNSIAIEQPMFIRKLADKFGSQSIVISMDVKKDFFGKYKIFKWSGKINTSMDPTSFAIQIEKEGAGEILLTSISNDGTFTGYDTALISMVSSAVNIPVIASGGAGRVDDFKKAVDAGAAAVAAGSMMVFQGKHRAVLINYPDQDILKTVLESRK